MKKGILCLLCCVLLIGVTGCGSNEEKVQKETQNIIEEFGIAEGCYSSDNDKEHLICFTNDLAYHDVLYKDGVYYNDPYYNVSPPTEDKKDYYEFTYSDKVLKIKYYSNNKLDMTDVCYSTGTEVLKCTRIGDEIIVQNGREEFTLTKVQKEFNKDIIKELPIYERNKEFNLIFNNETITCNLTKSYSKLNTMSSLVISNCLTKHFNKEYVATEMDNTGNWYIYSKDAIPSGMSNAEQLNYIKPRFAYFVTVNNQSFSYAKAFPINPYTTNEKMTVKATKVN